MRAKSLPFYYGWVVVAVTFITMAIGVNARTSFSLFYPPILSEFGWDRGVTAGAFSFGFVVSGIMSPLIGAFSSELDSSSREENASEQESRDASGRCDDSHRAPQIADGTQETV